MDQAHPFFITGASPNDDDPLPPYDPPTYLDVDPYKQDRSLPSHPGGQSRRCSIPTSSGTLEVPNRSGGTGTRRNSNENMTNNNRAVTPLVPLEEDLHMIRRGRKTPADAFFKSGKSPADVDHLNLSDDMTVGDAIFGPRFRNFFSDVSVVGLKYVAIGGVSWVRRLIWLMLVLLGLGFMIFQVTNRISYYLSWPTSVDVRISYSRSLRYPTVTICNENTVMKTMAIHNGFMELVQDMMPPYPWPEYKPNFTLYEPIFKALKENNTDWYEVYKSYSHPISDVEIPPSDVFPEGKLVWGGLIDCSYNADKCRSRDFDIVPTNMGFCYQFNGERFDRNTTRPGSMYGLQMLLYVGQVEYLASLSKSAGYRVLLHDPLEAPLMLEWGFKVNPGHVNLVTFSLENVTQLGSPYGDCSENSTYRFTTCAQSCLADWVVKQCNCQEFYFHHPTAPVCDLMERWQCVNGAIQQYTDENIQDECDCPHQCHEKKYKYTVSAAQASDHVIDFMAKTEFAHMPYDLVKNTVQNDFAVLEIFYSDLAYQEIKTSPAYTILSLLSDIGGSFGLVLGSTILTLIEFIDFFICLCVSGIEFHIAQKKDRARRLALSNGQQPQKKGQKPEGGGRQKENLTKQNGQPRSRQAFI